MDDAELVRGCAAEWEPGEVRVPRWMAVVLAIGGGAVVCGLAGILLVVTGVLSEAR